MNTFWTETTTIVVYLIDRYSFSIIDFKTPEDLRYGKQANCHYLKIFGCIAYAHINNGKLDTRIVKCIFIRYPQYVKGYKLWIDELGQHKFIISSNEKQMARGLKNILEVKKTNLDQILENTQFEVERTISQKDNSSIQSKTVSNLVLIDSE